MCLRTLMPEGMHNTKHVTCAGSTMHSSPVAILRGTRHLPFSLLHITAVALWVQVPNPKPQLSNLHTPTATGISKCAWPLCQPPTPAASPTLLLQPHLVWAHHCRPAQADGCILLQAPAHPHAAHEGCRCSLTDAHNVGLQGGRVRLHHTARQQHTTCAIHPSGNQQPMSCVTSLSLFSLPPSQMYKLPAAHLDHELPKAPDGVVC